MTTIIAHQGKLYADRRKVVNYPGIGILGSVDECKLHTTPYCHYATAGFDPEPNQRIHIEQLLCVVTSIDYMLFNTEFLKTPLGLILEKFKFLPTLLEVGDLVARWGFENINSHMGNIIAINRWNTFTTNGVLVGNANTVVLGACSKVAYTLLHNNVSIQDVYKVLRLHGAPTGEQFDSVDVSALDKSLLPPICDPGFIAKFIVIAQKFYKANKEVEQIDERIDKLSVLLMLFNELGRFDTKKNKLVIYKNAEQNILKNCTGKPSSVRMNLLQLIKGE